MPVSRIEKIVSGVVVQTATPATRGANKGKYLCHAFGTNVSPIPFDTLDDAAAYLRANPEAGIRMSPGKSKISEDVFIDGIPR